MPNNSINKHRSQRALIHFSSDSTRAAKDAAQRDWSVKPHQKLDALAKPERKHKNAPNMSPTHEPDLKSAVQAQKMGRK